MAAAAAAATAPVVAPAAAPAAGADIIKITSDPLEKENVSVLVGDNRAGAIATFVGTTRDHFDGKTVLRLEYEAYTPLAIKQLQLLCTDIRTRYGTSAAAPSGAGTGSAIIRIAILHRLGVVEVGQASVMIGVSSVHRKAALDACAYAIDTLKARIPIWKKEWYADGSVWKQNAEFDAAALVASTAGATPSTHAAAATAAVPTIAAVAAAAAAVTK